MLDDTTDFSKLVPGGLVLGSGLGLVSLRDPVTGLGFSLTLTGAALLVYSVLGEILDRFNMTFTDLL